MSVALSPIRPHAPGPLDVAAMLDAADERGHEQPCRVYDPELWFADSPADLERAKALCRGCPVRAACLTAALVRGEYSGVWGGEIFHRGRVLPHKRPRGRPRKDARPPV
jgi:WhiB family redox-sensing transcriptional regulator